MNNTSVSFAMIWKLLKNPSINVMIFLEDSREFEVCDIFHILRLVILFLTGNVSYDGQCYGRQRKLSDRFSISKLCPANCYILVTILFTAK